MVVVAGTPCHTRLLWVIDKLPVLFAKPLSTDSHIIAFSPDIVDSTFLPTIKVIPTWWETHKQMVVSATTSDQVLASLSSTATEIPALTTENYRAYLLLALLDPLYFLHPLLVATYLSPPTAYTLHIAQEAKLWWEDKMAPFLTWIRAVILPSLPAVASPPTL